MFDIGWSELAVIAVVALVVIGPKDLPRVLRTVGQWVARARTVARDFQNSIDEMAREADLQDVKKQIDELRTTNVADLLEKHVDPKGEIREALEPPPGLTAGLESGIGAPPPAPASDVAPAIEAAAADTPPASGDYLPPVDIASADEPAPPPPAGADTVKPASSPQGTA
ncbi:MAG: twin-arginine translocase subunit TatB [Alphaproteobacteria bacterium]|nr:twin-arginine translocase subunit TatB [Alphaproteobacteria bacterium]